MRLYILGVWCVGNRLFSLGFRCTNSGAVEEALESMLFGTSVVVVGAVGVQTIGAIGRVGVAESCYKWSQP